MRLFKCDACEQETQEVPAWIDITIPMGEDMFRYDLCSWDCLQWLSDELSGRAEKRISDQSDERAGQDSVEKRVRHLSEALTGLAIDTTDGPDTQAVTGDHDAWAASPGPYRTMTLAEAVAMDKIEKRTGTLRRRGTD